jgi:protein associated with RNAse G/E
MFLIYTVDIRVNANRALYTVQYTEFRSKDKQLGYQGFSWYKINKIFLIIDNFFSNSKNDITVLLLFFLIKKNN